MKKLITILFSMTLIAGLWGQSPEQISYQAVIRDAVDKLVADTEIGMQISILEGSVEGTVVYAELHSPTTNTNGLIAVEIGDGTVVTGDFSAIDWSGGPFYIKTETDPAGGTNYSITGTSQLLSVPYALFAKEVENKDDADADSTNELQTLSLKGNDLIISAGNTIGLPARDTLWRKTDTTVFVLDENVGVGLATPSSELDVKGVLRSSSGTTRYMEFNGQHRDGNAYINYQTFSRSGQMDFQLNGSSRMSILSNGNVGIGTTTPTERLEVNGNLLVKGDIDLDGIITGEISIDSVHVSQITGLLGQGYTMMFPDILNNYVEMDIAGVNLTEKVVMVGSLGHETERISTSWKILPRGDTAFMESPGLTMEFPVVFETDNKADVNTLKTWFDISPDTRSGSVIIRDLAGFETDRWNFYEYIPDSYGKGNDGRTRFKIKHNMLPDNLVRLEYVTETFGTEHSYNPMTDKWVEISGITHSAFTPAVEVDYRKRTITLTMDYPEGYGLAQWSYNTAEGKDNARSGSIIETTDGTTEISRRNYYEMIPIRYEVISGFGQNIKLKARIVIAFGSWEVAR